MRCDQCTLAPREYFLLSTEDPLFSRTVFCCFVPFGRATSPSSNSYTFLFFFKSGWGSKPTKVTRRERGGGRLARTWDLGTSLNNPPLFLAARRPFNPFLGLMSIFSSSSELRSTWAMTSLGDWATDCQSNLSSKFRSWIIGFAFSSLSS